MLEYLESLINHVLEGLRTGITERSGPILAGGPEKITTETLEMLGQVLPEQGGNPQVVVRNLSYLLARGAADPHDQHTIAHLHCPPLYEAIAVDTAVNTINPSLDSWDQAPSATVLEKALCREISRLTYPGNSNADTIITSGGTESNLIAVLVAREKLGKDMRVIVGQNSHHSLYRSCWQVGILPPIVLPTPHGVIDPQLLASTLDSISEPVMIVATAGTTDEGLIDPLAEITSLAKRYHARCHIDAAYGGMLLVSPRYKSLLAHIDAADSITLDFHKLSFQPIAASALCMKLSSDFDVLAVQADYLNAIDDSAAGIPDVLDRSIRTTRRLDALKVIASWQSLGQEGLAQKIDNCIKHAQALAALIDSTGTYERPRETIGISTVLFRPKNAAQLEHTTSIRRELLFQGQAVLGRAKLADGSVWLKATILNPDITNNDIETLLQKIEAIIPLAKNKTNF